MAAGTPEWPTITTEGAWFKIATNVVTGSIDRLKSQYTYWATYVPTGSAPPATAVKDKSPKIFEDSGQELIESSVAIDVYIWLENADTDTNDTSIANAIQVNI
jgi:hypothetical protein